MSEGPRANPQDVQPGGPGPGAEPPGVPPWVKVSALVIGVLVLVALLVMLIVGGDHGPGRHMSGTAETDLSAAWRDVAASHPDIGD